MRATIMNYSINKIIIYVVIAILLVSLVGLSVYQFIERFIL